MHSNEINKFIKNYIQNYKLKSAIMLSGDWGIGKSYYVQNNLAPFLKEHITEEFQCIIVSLYGLKTLDEISKQLFFEINFNKLAKPMKTVANVGKTIITGVSSFFNVKIDFSDKMFQNIYKNLNLNNKLIVFEDIERLDKSIDIVNFLGYVNNFVEHDGTKVLLVANENEIIKKVQTDSNESNTQETEETIEYKRMKEKTVSDTLYFTPKIEESIEAIGTLFENEFLTKALKDTKFVNNISRLMQSNDHYNLRSLIFAFQKSLDLLTLLENSLEIKLTEVIKEKIILNCVKLTVNLKSGQENTILHLESKNTNIIDSFNFCYYYIEKNYFDEPLAIDEIKLFNAERRRIGDNEDTDLSKIKTFYFYSEKEVLQSIENIKVKLDEDKVGYFQYQILATALPDIRYKVNLEFDIEHIKSIMIKNLTNTKVDLTGISLLQYDVLSDRLTDETKQFIHELKEAILNNKNYKSGLTFKNLNEVSTYIKDNRDKILCQRSFLAKFKLSDLSRLINQATSFDLYSFDSSINFLYGFSNVSQFFHDDAAAFKNLNDNLKQMITNEAMDKIKRYNIDQLCYSFENIFDKLNQEYK